MWSRTPEWLKEDPPLGRACVLEYAMFCLGHGLAMAGGAATQYALGRAHAEFEMMRFARERKKDGKYPCH